MTTKPRSPDDYDSMTREEALAKIAKDLTTAELCPSDRPGEILALRLGACILAKTKTPDIYEVVERYCGVGNSTLAAEYSFDMGTMAVMPGSQRIKTLAIMHWGLQVQELHDKLVSLGVPMPSWAEQVEIARKADEERAQKKGKSSTKEALDQLIKILRDINP